MSELVIRVDFGMSASCPFRGNLEVYEFAAQPHPVRGLPMAAVRSAGIGLQHQTRRYAALVVSLASIGSPSSIGSDGSRDHSFQEPKYIRTSFTPAFFKARKVFEARAPLKQ